MVEHSNSPTPSILLSIFLGGTKIAAFIDSLLLFTDEIFEEPSFGFFLSTITPLN